MAVSDQLTTRIQLLSTASGEFQSNINFTAGATVGATGLHFAADGSLFVSL